MDYEALRERIDSLEDQIRELREAIHGPLLYGMYAQGGGIEERLSDLESRDDRDRCPGGVCEGCGVTHGS